MSRRKLFDELLRTIRYDDAGQALIESALALSLLSVILLGSGQMGQILFAAIEVSDAARAGAEYGTQNAFTSSDTAGIAEAAQLDAPELTGLSTYPISGTNAGTSVTSACSCSDATSCDAGGNCASGHVIQTLTVNTQYTLTPFVKLPGLGSTFTLTGQDTEVCLQ